MSLSTDLMGIGPMGQAIYNLEKTRPRDRLPGICCITTQEVRGAKDLVIGQISNDKFITQLNQRRSPWSENRHDDKTEALVFVAGSKASIEALKQKQTPDKLSFSNFDIDLRGKIVIFYPVDDTVRYSPHENDSS